MQNGKGGALSELHERSSLIGGKWLEMTVGKDMVFGPVGEKGEKSTHRLPAQSSSFQLKCLFLLPFELHLLLVG